MSDVRDREKPQVADSEKVPEQLAASVVPVEGTVEAGHIVPSPEDAELQREADVIPDGGREAWLVVLGSSLALFVSAGMVNAYGAFQSYYESTLLPSSSSSSISLIGSLQVFFLFFVGTLTGRMFDAYGTSVMLPVGSVISVFALMMVSLAQKDHAYQVFLSHGVLFGIGISLLYNPSVAVLGHWFKRRRALAIGIATGGSASGGVIMPILLGQLIPRVGFPWAVRIIAFVVMGCLVVSCLTVRTRLPLSGHFTWRTAIDFGGWKDPRYTLATIAAFLLFYAFFIPYFYIQIYANFQGVAPGISDYLVAILNAMNVPARILPAIFADRYGTLTVFVPVAAVCSVLLLGLWLPSRNSASIIAFAALYGLFSGGFSSLLPTYIASISPRESLGARLGSVYMVVAVATLVGTPTGGALLKEVDQKHFNALIIFAGVLTTAGTVVLAIAGIVHSAKLRRLFIRRGSSSRQTEGAADRL
ncbi:monocarboxylate permease [Polyporus arcularius HHB13444]|uniref:Monocarboxylate permease n=1 Tax=Polyporus arcularius HHB13444 TaxID=1314778 RepID=A0A5C3PC24_9APHY|nr:monocarboxylate permease [Polyporus arcularius HHB13444]